MDADRLSGLRRQSVEFWRNRNGAEHAHNRHGGKATAGDLRRRQRRRKARRQLAELVRTWVG